MNRTNDVPVQHLLKSLSAGDRVALGRAITLVESSREDHRAAARALVESALPHSGKALRIGVTGVPGAGKSTLIEALGIRLVDGDLGGGRRRVAVLAVDPTSRVSGGSILGDKTRMNRLSSHAHAFVRPSPSRTAVGGVGERTREIIVLCEAAGYDTIIVETVGVGQAEIAVHAMVDVFLLLTLAGAGDELQGIKRGIIEMADVIAVTKADGENVAPAERARTQIASALLLFPPSDSGWDPRVRICSALNGDGIDVIWNDLVDYEARARASGYFEAQRREQAREWLQQTLDRRFMEVLRMDPATADLLASYESKVVEGEVSASAAVEAVLTAFRASSR